jgi:hypothetical protein
MGGGGKSSSFSPYAALLVQAAEHINKEMDPSRKLLMQQMQSVLQGNLYGSGTIPLIQQGVDAARKAASQSLTDTQGYLAQTGAARSPIAAAILGQLAQGGQEAVAGVPIALAQQYLGMAPALIGAGTNATMGGLASAIQGNLQQTSSKFSLG